MDDDDSLDRVLTDLFGAPTITVADEDRVLGRVVERAHRRIRLRRLTSAGVALVLFVTVGITVVVVASRHTAEVRVETPAPGPPPSNTVTSSHVVANLGICPSKYPSESIKALNAGVKGLATKLVPIAALTVRICFYSGVPRHLEGGRSLTRTITAQIEDETNRLPKVVPQTKRLPPCGANAPAYLVTFASNTQQVTVSNMPSCSFVTNGVLFAYPTLKWLHALQHYTTGSTATGTTTPTNVTVAALVGSWRPVSIAGYHGPLTPPKLVEVPVLRFDGKGSWTGSDGCHNWGGPYRLGAGGTFHLGYDKLVLADCQPNVGRPVDAAVRVELLNGRLTFFDRNGHELAQYERAMISARVVLPSTTMTAGSSMSGHVIVENNTGSPLHEGGCGGLFALTLGNSKIHQTVAFRFCAQRFTIPIGESSYPVTVYATYGIPPLPPGKYEATLVQSSVIVPIPPPIALTVTPQRPMP